MTRRIRPDVLFLVGALIGGYLALTPSAPRSASQPDANGHASAPSVTSPDRGNAGARSGAPLDTGVPPPTSSSERPEAAGSTRLPATARTAFPTQRPSPAPTPRAARMSESRKPSATVAPLTCGRTCIVRTGLASTYGEGWSEWWVALPEGPGWRFRVCGAGGCRTLVSHDAGPDRQMQREGRIVDLPVGAFEFVCGVSTWRVGLCPVTLTILGRA